jgi:hypothetical protein
MDVGRVSRWRLQLPKPDCRSRMRRWHQLVRGRCDISIRKSLRCYISNWADEVLVTCVWEALDVSGRGYCSRKLMTDDVEARLNGGLRDRASVRQLGSFNQDNETLLGSAGRFRPPDRPRLT